MPKNAITDKEIARCFDVMSQLRTELRQSDFVATVRAMEAGGFRLAYHEYDGEIVCVAGYRIYTNLLLGQNLYVDDLVTSDKARSKGFGAIMVNWLSARAQSTDCSCFRLDSGTARSQAHKFYFNQGFSIAAYSFWQQL